MATLTRQELKARKERAKAITPRDIEAAHRATQDAYRKAYCAQEFQSGTETLSMCYPGRVCRGQQLLTDFTGTPQERDIRKGYDALVKEGLAAGRAFEAAYGRYQDLCKKAGKKPGTIYEPCGCEYCAHQEEASALASIKLAVRDLCEEPESEAAMVGLGRRLASYMRLKNKMKLWEEIL